MNNYKINFNNTLAHHGVKGMKWGKWNEETAARYASAKLKIKNAISSSKGKVKNAFYPSIKGGKDKPNVSPVEKTVKETKNIVSTIKDINTKEGGSGKRRKKGYKEPGELSKEELQKVINRLNLERQYDNLTMEDYKTGLDYAEDILAIAGSVATIAAAIYMIKK